MWRGQCISFMVVRLYISEILVSHFSVVKMCLFQIMWKTLLQTKVTSYQHSTIPRSSSFPFRLLHDFILFFGKKRCVYLYLDNCLHFQAALNHASLKKNFSSIRKCMLVFFGLRFFISIYQSYRGVHCDISVHAYIALGSHHLC